jgi:hypothetical protein
VSANEATFPPFAEFEFASSPLPGPFCGLLTSSSAQMKHKEVAFLVATATSFFLKARTYQGRMSPADQIFFFRSGLDHVLRRKLLLKRS